MTGMNAFGYGVGVALIIAGFGICVMAIRILILYAALRNLLKELDEDPTGLQALYAMNGAKAALAKAVPQPERVNKDTVEEHR